MSDIAPTPGSTLNVYFKATVPLSRKLPRPQILKLKVPRNAAKFFVNYTFSLSKALSPLRAPKARTSTTCQSHRSFIRLFSSTRCPHSASPVQELFPLHHLYPFLLATSLYPLLSVPAPLTCPNLSALKSPWRTHPTSSYFAASSPVSSTPPSSTPTAPSSPAKQETPSSSASAPQHPTRLHVLTGGPRACWPSSAFHGAAPSSPIQPAHSGTVAAEQ